MFYLPKKRVIMPHSLQNKVEPDTTSKILKDKKKQGKSKKWYNGSGELVKKHCKKATGVFKSNYF